jgi:hypothetical protein
VEALHGGAAADGTRMTPYDDLLLWASEKQGGSLESLREACSWTASSVATGRRGQEVLDDLLALGHVEVADGRWAIVPTTLAVLADAGGNACFLGARPRWFLDSMHDLDGSSDSGLRDLADHVWDYDLVPQRGPGSWYIGLGPEAPVKALSSLGVRVIDSPAEALLQRAKADGARGLLRTARPGELAGTLVIEGPFATGSVVWEPVAGDRQPGCYRYLRNNQRVYAERTSEGWLEMDYRWAVWRAAPATAKCLWLSPRDRRLYVCSTARLPLELERAVVLRTGRLPRTGPALAVTGSNAVVATYDNITSGFATTVADLLGKELTLV